MHSSDPQGAGQRQVARNADLLPVVLHAAVLPLIAQGGALRAARHADHGGVIAEGNEKLPRHAGQRHRGAALVQPQVPHVAGRFLFEVRKRDEQLARGLIGTEGALHVAVAGAAADQIPVAQLLGLGIAPLKHQAAHLVQMGEGLRVVAAAVVLPAAPEGLFVQLHPLFGNAAVDHHAQPSVAQRQRLVPVPGGLVVP